jgi:hypothetical protein
MQVLRVFLRPSASDSSQVRNDTLLRAVPLGGGSTVKFAVGALKNEMKKQIRIQVFAPCSRPDPYRIACLERNEREHVFQCLAAYFRYHLMAFFITFLH